MVLLMVLQSSSWLKFHCHTSPHLCCRCYCHQRLPEALEVLNEIVPFVQKSKGLLQNKPKRHSSTVRFFCVCCLLCVLYHWIEHSVEKGHHCSEVYMKKYLILASIPPLFALSHPPISTHAHLVR